VDGGAGIGSLGFTRANRSRLDYSPPAASSSRHRPQHIPSRDTTLTEFITETRQQNDAASSLAGFPVVSPPRVVGQKKSMQQLAIEKYKNMQDSFSVEVPARRDQDDEEDEKANSVHSIKRGGIKGKRRLEDDDDLLFQMSEIDLQ